jgi:hypothetical protein
MAAKRRALKQQPRGPRGPRGKTGPRGKAGPEGPPGHSHTREIARLSAAIHEIVKELHIQLTRIAQIQAQLDRLASGQPPEPVADVSDARRNH